MEGPEAEHAALGRRRQAREHLVHVQQQGVRGDGPLPLQPQQLADAGQTYDRGDDEEEEEWYREQVMHVVEDVFLCGHESL